MAATKYIFVTGGVTSSLGKGIIDTYAIACSLVLAAGFLILAIRRLDGQRLRG